MVPKCAVALVVLCAAFAAGASEASLSHQDAPADLRSLQASVREVAEEIDGMHDTAADDEADAMATGDLGDAAPTLTALPHEASPLEQLESADTASDGHIQKLTADSAAVQAQDTANDLEEEDAEEEDPASKQDARKAIELANNLKQSDLLPSGWEEKTDAQTGKNYYENKAAGKTTWDPPRSLVSIALAAARGQRASQNQITSLKLKLEEMSSSKDLGEGASTQQACAAQKTQIQEAAVLHVKEFLSKMDKTLNLTGEQQKLLAAKMKALPFSFVVEPTADHAKLKHEVVIADGKAKPKSKKEKHDDLGESMEEDQAAKDKIAMVEAEAAAQKAAQASAIKEATQLHNTDVEIQKQVAAAAKKKDRELAMQDKELEKSAKADDKLTAEIMGPKATKAEKREEKVLLGESTSNVDQDNEDKPEEESSEEELGESSSTDEDAQDEFAVSDDKDEFEASPNANEYEEE